MTDKLKALVKKWIQEEMAYARAMDDSRKEENWTKYGRELNKKDFLSIKRRELQEAAGLVVKPD